MPKPQPHISPRKREEVESIKTLIKEYPLFGLVNMENLPTLPLQRMRTKLKDTLQLKMSKKRLILFAFDQLKGDYPGLDQVAQSIQGMPALLFTKENPFTLYKLLAKNKTKAPAKAGQIAPFDIVIPAGPTPFTPGPMIGELGHMGIRTKVDGGKISVLKDTVLVKEGQPIPPKAADLLAQLKIEPMEVGLNMLLVYEKGTLFPKEVLAVDEAAYLGRVQTASRDSFALAIEIGYISKDIIEPLIHKAARDAKALATSQKILTSETMGEMVAQAEREILQVAKLLPEEVVASAEPASSGTPSPEPAEDVPASAAAPPTDKSVSKKGATRTKGKGPSTEELLNELEKEEGAHPAKKNEMKAIEDLTKKIIGGQA